MAGNRSRTRLKPEENRPTRAARLESRAPPHECGGSHHRFWKSMIVQPSLGTHSERAGSHANTRARAYLRTYAGHLQLLQPQLQIRPLCGTQVHAIRCSVTSPVERVGGRQHRVLSKKFRDLAAPLRAQKLPVDSTKVPPPQVVIWACTRGQFCCTHCHARSRVRRSLISIRTNRTASWFFTLADIA